MLTFKNYCQSFQGSEQRQQGHSEYNAAKANNYLGGAQDHVTGRVSAAVDHLVGDKEGEARAQERELRGENQMEFNKLG